MRKNIENEFEKTIEELCFLAHMLIKDEETEDDSIVCFYQGKDNEKSVTSRPEDIPVRYIFMLKEKGIFRNGKIVNNEGISDNCRDSLLVDMRITDYIFGKRREYLISEDRKNRLWNRIADGE